MHCKQSIQGLKAKFKTHTVVWKLQFNSISSCPLKWLDQWKSSVVKKKQENNTKKEEKCAVCAFLFNSLERLTIMFSRAPLASQQLRKTGTNMFLKGGQKIFKRREKKEENRGVERLKFNISDSQWKSRIYSSGGRIRKEKNLQWRFTHRDYKWHCIDHLQYEGYLEYLLPNVPLEKKNKGTWR